MARIRLQHVAKRYGSSTAVEPMSLDIADGEFVVLLGPSGCGKSTTMRMVAGLEDLSEGEIWIGDRCVNRLEPKDRDVAMVFQSYGLYPNMTVAQNIGFPLKVRGLPASQIDPAVATAAQQVELTDYLQRRPKELSGGQRQRVALARAIVRRPAVFLMDEPLSNLDAKLRVTMRAHIKHLHTSLGVTTIYVTHDQVEAMTLADRVVVMSRARIQQIGTPEEIYDRPTNLFVAGFVGSPPMNLLPGMLQGGVFEAPGVRLSGFDRRHADAGQVVLGIRPEDLVVDATSAPPRGDSARIEAEVFACEMTGDASFVTARVSGHLLTAKAAKQFRAAPGARVSFGFDTARCHLYDAQSEQRLPAP
ncbi:MAG: sn-glycerol-3-phosphate ABC transporter ATP-binding protein UgpC, partial [Pseudomonadota bacterium]|nr:sn-glycerol-3-phosphate ABC transporter ATP-binding protein UgpC [Pseudomonadota bacterium]